MAEQLQALQSQVQVTKKSGADDLAKKPLDSASFSDKEIGEIKAWYGKKNYSKSVIKSIQQTVGTTADGIIGKNTINAIAAWQRKEGLTADGKFGAGCAAHAGVQLSSGGGSSNAGGSQDIVVPEGQGINPAPLFQKQLDYPNTPYVNKADYLKMKSAMGDTPYSQWKVSDPKISKLYATARANNGGASTIKSSGCGVTSLANVKKITPTESAEMSMKSGCRIYKKGTAASFMENNGGASAGSAINALKAVANGKYLVCSMGKGNWCGGDGHFILVYGFDGANVYVSDPYSYNAGRAKAAKSLFTASYKYGYLF